MKVALLTAGFDWFRNKNKKQAGASSDEGTQSEHLAFFILCLGLFLGFILCHSLACAA